MWHLAGTVVLSHQWGRPCRCWIAVLEAVPVSAAAAPTPGPLSLSEEVPQEERLVSVTVPGIILAIIEVCGYRMRSEFAELEFRSDDELL